MRILLAVLLGVSALALLSLQPVAPRAVAKNSVRMGASARQVPSSVPVRSHGKGRPSVASYPHAPVPEPVSGLPAQTVAGQPGYAGAGVQTAPNTLGAGFARPVYSVRTSTFDWTPPNRTFRVSGLAYCPSAPSSRCPVVIFSHGLGGSPERFAYLANMWASRGIVTLLLRHPETDETQWRGKIRPRSELKELYRKYWSARDRALTIRFVIDRLQEQCAPGAAVSGNGLAAVVDPARIGVAGNNLGALGALEVAGQLPPDNGASLADPRVSAVLALGPPVYCQPNRAPIVYAGVKVPFMSIAGTEDNGLVGTTEAWQRRIPYDGISGVPHFHATLEGGDHMVYSGHLMAGRQTGDAVYQNAIRSISTVFWTAFLLDDRTARQMLETDSPALMSKVMRLEGKLK